MIVLLVFSDAELVVLAHQLCVGEAGGDPAF